MIYYVECGTEFTCAFGDIDETFYCSLESMFDDVLKLMNDNGYSREFNNRLDEIVRASSGIGWGYYDAIKDMWDEWQQKHVMK